LNDQIGPNFQKSEDCRCQALFDQQVEGQANRQRTCACNVCPVDAGQALSLDCNNVPEDPFILSTCTAIDCYGRCNYTGPVVINLPTPPPGNEEETAPSGAISSVIGFSGFFLTMLFSGVSFLFASVG
jgi:hypothetical protein